MSGLFEDISQFDEGVRISRRQAAAVAQKRVADHVGGYLRLAKSTEEYDARLNFVSDDIRKIVADVAEEYETDKDRLLEAIDEHLKGDGVSDLTDDLEGAPSAVGVGHQAGGHKPGCECGFCKNKGKLPGTTDDEDEESDSEESEDSGVTAAMKEALTAKDFVMLADAIAKAPNSSPELAHHFADYLAQTNPRFDRERFVAAATGSPLSGRDRFNNPQEAPLPPADPTDPNGYKVPPVPGPNQQPQIDPAFQKSMDDLLPRSGGTHQADAPKDGGGAVEHQTLPKGDGKAVGTEPSPKTDHKTWRPNALNDSTNTPPVDTQTSGSPHPTDEQDITDTPDYKGDFLRDTDAVTDHQDLPTATENSNTTEKNISQEGQGGTWTEAQNDPVTSSVDPDVNPLKAILDSGFTPNNQVESAIQSFKDKE